MKFAAILSCAVVAGFVLTAFGVMADMQAPGAAPAAPQGAPDAAPAAKLASSSAEKSRILRAREPVNTAAYTVHPEINIWTDDGFINNSAVTGGSGTKYDPYIIEGWDVTCGATCIWMQQIDKYSIIRNCYFHTSTTDNAPLFYAVMAHNMTIENCVFEDAILALQFDLLTTGNLVRNNTFNMKNNDKSECMFQGQNSNDNVFIDNLMVDSTYGFYMKVRANSYATNRYENNTFDNCSTGIQLNNVTGSFFYGNAFNTMQVSGISILRSDGNTFAKNVFSGMTLSGISVTDSEGDKVIGNTICYSKNGISFTGTNYSEFADNDVYNCNSTAISLIGSKAPNTIKWNTITGCGKGISIMTTRKAYIYGNEITGCVAYAVQMATGCDSNYIFGNNFVSNNGAGSTYDAAHVQAYDLSSFNHWNGPDGGNHWSDWTGPDVSPADGIVDSPYILDGGKGAKDLKPLADPAVVPELAGAMSIAACAALIGAIGVLARRRKTG